MLREVAFEHFKAFRDRVRVPLAPLTLLFGGNSAGKSSVIHGLHFAREVLVEGNLDPDRTRLGGAQLDLGGFVNMAHKHDLSRPVVLSFVIDGDELSGDEERDEPTAGLVLGEGARVRVELGLRSGNERRSVWVSYIELFVGDATRPAARVECSGAGAIVATLAAVDPVQWSDELDVPTIVEAELGKEAVDAHPPPMIYGLSEQWGLVREFGTWSFADPAARAPDDVNADRQGFDAALRATLDAVCSTLRDELNRLLHVGPIRSLPDRQFRSPKSPTIGRWYSGLAAWDLLQHSREPFVELVNSWLRDRDGIDARVGVRVREMLEVAPERLRLAIAQARNDQDFSALDEIERQPSLRSVIADDLERNVAVAPRDLGVGMSQVIPVVVAALQPEKALIAIEQPELHVHPRVAVGLGDLFITQLGRNKQFLIETHSEHLLLRVLRRLRETSEGGVKKPEHALSPEQVSVVYFDAVDGVVTALVVRLDATGAFLDAWPHGFFEERLVEVVGTDEWSMPSDDVTPREP
jgi:hypothetical protein